MSTVAPYPVSHPTDVSGTARRNELTKINFCCFLEVCCKGRSLAAGSLAVALLEIFGVIVFIIWPILLISGVFKGFAAEIEGQAGGVKSRSTQAEEVVVYEARMLYGEKMFILGSEPRVVPDPLTRAVGNEAIMLDLEKVGLTADELKEISTVTVLYPLALCITIFVASILLIIAAFRSDSMIGIFSGILHALASFTLFVYFLYIIIIIDRMMGSLKKWQESVALDRSGDAFERLSLTWPLWLQLFHLLLYPGTFCGTLCGFNIFILNYKKEKPSMVTFDWESSKATFDAPPQSDPIKDQPDPAK